MPGTEKVVRVHLTELRLYFVPGDVAIQIHEDAFGKEDCKAIKLDRPAINNLIKKLREARDYSYGRDQ